MDGRVEFQDGALKRQLQEIGRRAEDLTPLMDMIGPRLRDAARNRIASTNVGPDGVPWPVSFRAKTEGGKTLLDTTDLSESLTWRASAREVEIGSNLIYAAIHQFGGDIVPVSAGALTFRLANGQMVTCGKVTIPARPYLGVSDEDEVILTDLALTYLAGEPDVD